jgi:hypothetical protein
MRSDMGRRTRQVLLLCALALSVIGMHHVPMSPHVTMSVAAHTAPTPEAMTPTAVAVPAVQPADDSGTGTGHDLLHLCLVVLGATGGLLFLAWLLAAAGAGTPTLSAGFRRWSRRAWRPPGMAGRSLLTFVCVLRT